MQTYGFWFYDELRPLVGWGKPPIVLATPNYGEFKVKASSTRLECFVRNNVCVVCGRVGDLWLLQSHVGESPHLNLFSVGENGMRLMTQDHHIPRYLGGPNTLDNLDTMCSKCNNDKGCLLPEDYQKKLVVRGALMKNPLTFHLKMP